MNKYKILEKFLNQDKHKPPKTDIEDSHFGLMALLEEIVSESKWCSKEEFRDACEDYKFNFLKK